MSTPHFWGQTPGVVLKQIIKSKGLEYAVSEASVTSTLDSRFSRN